MMQRGTIADSIRLADESDEWGSFKLGTPGLQDKGPWLALSEAYDPAIAASIAQRFNRLQDYVDIPYLVVGNYAFREFCYKPLTAQGALFALQRRVLRLDGNLMVRDFEYLQHWRLLQPIAYVLPDDPAAGEPATEVLQTEEELTEALFAEVIQTYEPLVASFRANRFVAPANAWGSIIDFLGYGFWHAGEHGLGMDAAWGLWESVTAGRKFPTRRRPRRFVYELDGKQEELPIRAGCCLWYTTDDARSEVQSGDHSLGYCTTCYIPSDQERLDFLRTRPHDEEVEGLTAPAE